jgi:TetR/AcrR family transcriptional repressor of mexJK operon
MSNTETKTKGRPKDPDKRCAILEVAGKLFLEQGYERTSVDTIADKAGVSKFTVYSHFKDKAGLFTCLVTNKCQEYPLGGGLDQIRKMPLKQALTKMAEGYVSLMLNPDVLAFQRLMIADATNNPELTVLFYESGPKPTIQAAAEMFTEFHNAGKAHIEDSRQAADHFLSMLRGIYHWRALLNVDPMPTRNKLRKHIEDCVNTFMRAYAVNDN